MLHKPTLTLAAALALACSVALTAQAQDAGALVDKLIKKGILTDQEGEEVRADMMRDFSQTNAGKINLSDSVTSLKLYGDLRMRWTYTDTQLQVPDGSNVSQRSRWQYRLRLNAEVQLGPDWFAGVQLQTGQTPDSGNQTFSGGFNNDSIYISRAYLGWHNDWLKVVAGKQINPIYTTDLLWDPDINPAGVTETIAFHKMPLFGGSGGPSGDGKSGKDAGEPSRGNPWEVTLVGGQFIIGDNNEFNAGGDLSTDPLIFDQQLIVKYNFNKDTSVTVAPGFLAENAAHVSGSLGKLAFSDENAIVTSNITTTTTVAQADVIKVSYDGKGVPTKTVTPTTITTTNAVANAPVTTTATQLTKTKTAATAVVSGGPFSSTGAATGLPTDPSKANLSFTTTVTNSTASATKTTTNGLPAVTGETRALHILTAPGDISFKLGGLKSKLYWDVAYNVSGRDRYDNIYQLKDFGSREYRTRDSLAWLVGAQVGEIKKAGDWAAYLNYRETGIASIDPNINDDDAAQSALNMRGFKLGLGYALTDFVVVNATGFIFSNLDNVSGGRATSAGGIAPYNSSNVVLLDFSIKF